MQAIVVSRLLDGESQDFAGDIRSTLIEAGWVSPPDPKNWTRADKGVFIGTVGGAKLPPISVLAAALDAAKNHTQNHRNR
jgi:hypothetical protein